LLWTKLCPLRVTEASRLEERDPHVTPTSITTEMIDSVADIILTAAEEEEAVPAIIETIDAVHGARGNPDPPEIALVEPQQHL
jgi:hypothetical protein